jgi:hypothetical protein
MPRACAAALHHEVAAARIEADVEHAHDIGVIDRTHPRALLDQRLDLRRVLGELGPEELQRDLAAGVLRGIDLAGRAAPDQLSQSILSDGAHGGGARYRDTRCERWC